MSPGGTHRLIATRAAGAPARDRNAALLVIAQWQEKGIPEVRGKRPIGVALDVDAVVHTIRSSNLTGADARENSRRAEGQGAGRVCATERRPRDRGTRAIPRTVLDVR